MLEKERGNSNFSECRRHKNRQIAVFNIWQKEEKAV